MSNNNQDKITKNDINRIGWRWIIGGQSAWNYDKMQGLGYCFAMIPIMEKLYKSKDDLQKALKTHLQFFNTNPYMGGIIVGMDTAMEEAEGVDSLEAVSGIKLGLMGPLAGIGDTLFHVIVVTVLLSIGSYMGLQGSSIGVWMWLAWSAVLMFLRIKMTHLGYSQGTKLITSVGDTLNRITEAANVLGITVIGALIPSVIKTPITYVFTQSDVTLELQEIFNQIMPGLLPVALVAFIYWLLGKEGMSSTKAIILVVVLAVILTGLGILG